MRGLTRVWIRTRPYIDEEKLASLEAALSRLGFQVAVHPAHPLLSDFPRLSSQQAVEWADFALVVGGDGTLLKVFHETRGALPLLGVNSGDSVGFLMDVTLDNALPALELVAQGEYTVDTRLAGEVVAGGWNSAFVNEVAVLASRCGTLLRAKILLDEEPLMEGRLDGIIVATSTGSTAYALSAGGPILDPSLDAFAIVPIAPFSALMKPFVISASRKLTVAVEGGCSIVVDGAITTTFDNCTVTVARAPVNLRLIRVSLRESFQSKLARRLLDLLPTRGSIIPPSTG